MFDDIQEPQDLFADDAKKNEALVPKPVAPSAQKTSPDVELSSLRMEPETSPAPSGAFARMILFVIISLICIGGAGYAAYRFLIRDAVPQEVADSLDQQSSTTVPTNNAQKPLPEDSSDESGPTAVVDSDGDGLSNEEERALGTSVAKPDTDADGLGDKEEVRVYGTNPRDEDTDGDGYTDGEEVKNGYNPNGQGRLQQIPQ